MNLKPFAFIAILSTAIASSVLAETKDAQTRAVTETVDRAVPPPPPPPNHPNRGKDCEYFSTDTLNLKPGVYPSCILRGKKVVLSGNGDFTIGDSLIDAETLIIKSNGFVDLSVSDIRADKVVFSQGASVTMLGTTIIAKTICGYLRGTYASGVKMIAQDQISLNLINADL